MRVKIPNVTRCSRPISQRHLHSSLPRLNSQPKPVEGASDISHAHFISSASRTSDFNPTQKPSAGVDTAHPWEGTLSPTTSHLFKLILPLPTQSWKDKPPQPTAFLLHPSQPLSHLSRLIAGSLPSRDRNVEISYLALTGQESDLDTHLRNAEEESSDHRREGGPHLQERRKSEGRWQEVSWSQSTDLSDFIKQSCLNERFKVVIKPESTQDEMTLEVVIPSFKSRTVYLRKRLLELTGELDGMTKQKKAIDIQAHQGARRLIVMGLIVGVGYWITVVRWTFFTDAGWDVMEPVTWTVGFGSVLTSAAFLAYHNREVSYSSLLDLSITARQRTLYEKHGLDIDRWTEMVAEAKTLRREIIRIAADYDIEWKGELENLAEQARKPIAERQPDELDDPKIDIDKTIDEADELASRSEEQRDKEKAAQRKGEVVEDKGAKGEGQGGKDNRSSEDRGVEKAEELAKKKTS